MIKLTPGQDKIYRMLSDVLKDKTVICLTGPDSSGKKLIADKYVKELKDKKVLTIDIDKLVPMDTYDMYDVRRTLRDIEQRSLEYDLLYLRDFERALQITTSYRFKLTVDVANLYVDFLNHLTTKTIAICSVANGRSLISENVWAIQLKIKDHDREMIINQNTDLDTDERDKVISYCKGNSIKEIIIGIKRADRLYKSDPDKNGLNTS